MCSLLSCLNCQDFYAGYYSYNAAYLNDEPKPYHYTKRMLFGLPKGGFSASGKSYGLTAYLYKLNSWDELWRNYYSHESVFAPVRLFGHPHYADELLNLW